MIQFPMRLSHASGLVLAAATLILTNSVPARAATPSVPVTVTNTPLPVQGTVQVTGTPAVQVTSSVTAPVYVDADRPARNGFNASCFTGNVDAVYGQASCTLFSIPAGRQVVIETISCQAELYAGDGPGDVQLIVPNTPLLGGADHVSHMLTLSKQASSASLDIWRMTTPLKAYASAPAQGSTAVGLFFRANPARPGPQDMICTVSGYLVGQ